MKLVVLNKEEVKPAEDELSTPPFFRRKRNN